MQAPLTRARVARTNSHPRYSEETSTSGEGTVTRDTDCECGPGSHTTEEGYVKDKKDKLLGNVNYNCRSCPRGTWSELGDAPACLSLKPEGSLTDSSGNVLEASSTSGLDKQYLYVAYEQMDRPSGRWYADNGAALPVCGMDEEFSVTVRFSIGIVSSEVGLYNDGVEHKFGWH